MEFISKSYEKESSGDLGNSFESGTRHPAPGTYEYLFFVNVDFTEDPNPRFSDPIKYESYESVIIAQSDK